MLIEELAEVVDIFPLKVVSVDDLWEVVGCKFLAFAIGLPGYVC